MSQGFTNLNNPGEPFDTGELHSVEERDTTDEFSKVAPATDIGQPITINNKIRGNYVVCGLYPIDCVSSESDDDQEIEIDKVVNRGIN